MSRVLIVDDKEDNLYYLDALLRGHGFTVESARHGAEALVLARSDPPDLIISDLLMPVMDGYTLLRHWKADVRLGAIPFIVYTATYTEAEDERLALSLGADTFILKPSEPEDFLARIREVQANRAAARPTPPRHQSGDETSLLKIYSEALIRKLEEKTLQLEEANKALRKDIAARQHIEEHLRESEERFRATFEHAAVGIAHVSPDGYFTRVNDKLCEITGYTRDELLKLSFQELTAPEDRAEGEGARLAMLEGKIRLYTAEKRYRRKDGATLWVSIVTTLLREDSGKSKYFITVTSDITERKALEDRVLRGQRLESIGTLAGGIAHDLNNILTPIVMGVELLREEVTHDASRRVVETIALSAQRGAHLVKQVLSFARGVEGARVAVHLGHVVREIAALVQNTFPKNIAFQTSIPRDLWLVTGDPTQLNQVILNLCVNARDALPEGGKLIVTAGNLAIDEQSAAMRRDVKPGRYVLIEVKDTGSGIPPELVSRIFEPFFTTKEPGKGTGLGLSTVLGLVRGHGGFIEVDSTPGKGTTFRVHLPAHRDSAPVEPPQRAPAALPRGRGETVLVVDDEVAVRRITASTLEAFGYRTISAEDGTDAIGIYATHRDQVKVVITDIMMPNMDGIALAGALRRISPTLPIVAASGINSDGDAARAAAAGISYVLAKPFSAETLLERIRCALDEAEPPIPTGDALSP